MVQPVARIEIVRDIHYGTVVEDPYRWMEDLQNEEMQIWIKTQAEYSTSYLETLPERAAFLKRITELTTMGTTSSTFTLAGGKIFYLRREPDENLAKLIVQSAEGEKTLCDPNTFSGEAQASLDWYYPSRDGQRVAYGIAQGGSEDCTLSIIEVESGQVHDLAISRTMFGAVNWLDDHHTFLYTRFPAVPADTPPTERRYDRSVYLHRLGSDPEQDPRIFGYGVNPRVEIAHTDTPFVHTSSVSDWMIGLVIHGTGRDLTLYCAPLAALRDPATCPWTKIVDIEDGVTSYAFLGDMIYLKTHKNAPRYNVLAMALSHPDLAHAPVLVPESLVVIEDILVAGDYLVMQDLDGGIGGLRCIPLQGGKPETIPLPVEGTISKPMNEEAGPDLLIYFTSWTISPRLYRYHMVQKTLIDSGVLPPSPVDMSEIEVHEVFAPGKDGTPIPLSLLHKKGLVHNGENPTILYAYGSYGITLHASFIPAYLAWYERGGIFAFAHIRGGGEYGDAWYKAGHLLRKGNTIDDFIACAEYLIAQGYTRPERLAGEGGSAGGIPTSGALVRRPDLWSAMLMQVPVVNALRFELSENGPANIPEFGSVATEDGFKGLLIMDSYSRVREGESYPAVLLTAGINDPRVVAWQPAKMAARLQAVTTGKKPTLLRVEFQGGHGMGSTIQQKNEELADMFAFLWQQFGM